MGATGKSAQIPLHTWLPDAMEGPTPVSALIHAATMVTAGVYLLVRMHPLFLLAPTTLQVVGIIGAVTSLFAALCAIGQTDLKRVLAYSTVSQLGLMFLACGAGAFYAAMFHLTTHAFMKSLLFLSAGNLVHMMHGTTDMGKMGGLKAKFPVTQGLFLIGVLAMSGLPPFAAFFSKDLILEDEFVDGYYMLFTIALIASILTGYYLMRAYFLTFRGKPNLDEKILKVAEEAPKVMLAPLFVLALLSIVGGLLGPFLWKFLHLKHSHGEEELSHGFHLTDPSTWLAIASAFIGFGAAIWIYIQHRSRMTQPRPVLKHGFYVDQLYDTLFVRPLKGFAAWVADWFEPNIIDRMIQAGSRLMQKISVYLQRLQSGEIRSYAAWMVVGAAALILQIVLWELHG